MKKLIELVNQGSKAERPLFYLLTIIMAIMFFWSLSLNPALLQPGMLILFALLMNLHIVMHWLAPAIETYQKYLPWYLLLQCALAFSITYLAGNIGMVFALYLGLIGEFFGISRVSRWGIVGIVSFLVLSMVNYGLIVGWNQIIWWAVGIIPTSLFVAVYVILYSRQSEARLRAQALLQELEVANRQLTEYAARVEDLTIASERQRMARELHDTLSQGLAGVILQLEAVDAHLSSDHSERAQEILQQTMERARTTLSESRKAIENLRHGQTGVEDLAEAVRNEVEHFTRSTGIPCGVDLIPPERLSDETCEVILRTISEALTNVASHAQASQVNLRLGKEDDHLVLDVRDNGIGFNLQEIKPGHYGLLGIHERARLAGGSMEVESTPGKGTAVRLRLPLSQENPPDDC